MAASVYRIGVRKAELRSAPARFGLVYQSYPAARSQLRVKAEGLEPNLARQLAEMIK